MKKMYELQGTGNQAPYGIGEIIAVYRTRKAAERAAQQWYNQPAIAEIQK